MAFGQMAGIGATSPLERVSVKDRSPPDSAVRPGRPERRVCARLQPFTAEVDPTRLSLLTVANAEMRMADEIDRTLARPSGAARVLSATGGEGRQIRPQTHRRGALPTSKIRRHCRIMRRNRSEGESAPMTLGQALARAAGTGPSLTWPNRLRDMVPIPP